ncbi:unnamed protein product, partial [Prorocentrum cordatum]
ATFPRLFALPPPERAMSLPASSSGQLRVAAPPGRVVDRSPRSPKELGGPRHGADSSRARRPAQAGGPGACPPAAPGLARGEICARGRRPDAGCTPQHETFADAPRRWLAAEVKEPPPIAAAVALNLLQDYLDASLEEGGE